MPRFYSKRVPGHPAGCMATPGATIATAATTCLVVTAATTCPGGRGDNQPNVMGQLIQKNNQVRPLLNANRDMIYGTGIGFFKRITEGGTRRLEPFTDARLDEWTFQTRLPHYLIGAINERLQNGNHFTRIEFMLDGTPLLSVSDGFATRIGRPGGPAQGQFLYNPNFGDWAYFRPRESETIARFNPIDPTSNVVSLFHSREPMSGNPFYAYPSWWGAQDWVELANLIPIFHKSGLTNGYNIKYLIRIPKDYFDQEGGKTVPVEKIRQRWAEFSDNLSSWLAGHQECQQKFDPEIPARGRWQVDGQHRRRSIEK